MTRRRPLLIAAAAAAAGIALPALASSRRVLAAMTEGPFYPSAQWRSRWSDWDADLTRVQRGSRVLQARGEPLALALQVADGDGRTVDNAEVEIWQCDTLRAYRHERVPLEPGGFDEGFQGFGAARSDASGQLAFRTIRPVAYPGRTPHIHVRLRHASFGELTSQLFVDGDAGNARDFLWRSLAETDRETLAMKLVPGGADGVRWTVRHVLTVPA